MTFRGNGDIEEAGSTAQQSGINISFSSEFVLVKVLEQQDWSVVFVGIYDEAATPYGYCHGDTCALLGCYTYLARDGNIPVYFCNRKILGRPVVCCCQKWH